jgi:hypothetical protein
MISFIKDFSLHSIKLKLLLLYLLNVTDIVFTLILLKTGYFKELNILLVNIVNNPTACVGLKVVLPAILLLYIFIRLKKASEQQLRISNLVINIGISIYVIINLSHFVWFTGLLII